MANNLSYLIQDVKYLENSKDLSLQSQLVFLNRQIIRLTDLAYDNNEMIEELYKRVDDLESHSTNY